MFGIIFQKEIPIFENIYITLLTISLVVCLSVFLFFKDFLFNGTIHFQNDKIQVNKNNINKDFLYSEIKVISINVIGESGKGWALLGASGALNKIEIYTVNNKEINQFYLSNTNEIKKLKKILEIIKNNYSK